MKKILFIVVAFLSCNLSFGQFSVAVTSGDCSQGTINVNITQPFPRDLFAGGGIRPGSCILTTSNTGLNPKIVIFRQVNGVMTVFETRFDVAISTDFSNVPSGVYQVGVQFPTPLVRAGCTETVVFGTDGRRLGRMGILSNTILGNTFRIGATSLDDLNWNFIDANGSNPSASNNLYAPNELVRIQATVNQNYDSHFIIMSEVLPNGSSNPNNWRAKGNNGWGAIMPGKIGDANNIESITDVWTNKGLFSWFQFEVGKTYRVSVVPTTTFCDAWTGARTKEFFVCPQGWGCKVLFNDDVKITLSPNPTNAAFTLNNLDFDRYKDKNLSVNVYDIAGKEVKNFKNISDTNFDVQDIQNGMYVVSVFANDKRIYNTKLVVKK